jgi:glutathione synthase
MRTVFIVNDRRPVHPDRTTGRLIRCAARRGPTVVVAAADLRIDAAGCGVCGHEVLADGTRGPPVQLTPAPPDRVVVRANLATLPRPWQATFLLDALDALVARGVSVVNAPGGMRRFAHKAGLRHLPDDTVLPTATCGHTAAVLETVARFGPSAIKPAVGSHGRGVLRTSPAASNLPALAELLLETGPVVVQPWVESDGDLRVIVLDGSVVRVDGRALGIHRRSAPGEHRSNVHRGADATVVELQPALLAVATRVGRALAAHGVRLAGLDCVGGRVLEVNVCSPGGLHDLEDATGTELMGPCLDALHRASANGAGP